MTRDWDKLSVPNAGIILGMHIGGTPSWQHGYDVRQIRRAVDVLEQTPTLFSSDHLVVQQQLRDMIRETATGDITDETGQTLLRLGMVVIVTALSFMAEHEFGGVISHLRRNHVFYLDFVSSDGTISMSGSSRSRSEDEVMAAHRRMLVLH